MEFIYLKEKNIKENGAPHYIRLELWKTKYLLIPSITGY